MGDIDEQTVAGAISTGTHGTGGHRASLSAQVSGLELVTGKGELLQADAHENADVLDVARLGLGAIGILTSVTFDVEPMFTLEAHEAPMLWDEGLDRFEELADGEPPLRDVLVPAHRAAADQAQQPDPRRRPSRCRGCRRWFDDEFLSNRVFGWTNRIGNRRPGLVRTDQRHLRTGPERAPLLRRAAQGVHLQPRRVVFREMEYAVPREVALEALREVRATIDAERLDDQLPDRDPRLSRRRRTAVDGVPARLGLPRLPHERPDRPHRLLPRRRGASCAATTAAPTGASCTPAPPPTSRRLPALGRRPGAARAARPRPGLHQRLPRPGPRP